MSGPAARCTRRSRRANRRRRASANPRTASAVGPRAGGLRATIEAWRCAIAGPGRDRRVGQPLPAPVEATACFVVARRSPTSPSTPRQRARRVGARSRRRAPPRGPRRRRRPQPARTAAASKASGTGSPRSTGASGSRTPPTARCWSRRSIPRSLGKRHRALGARRTACSPLRRSGGREPASRGCSRAARGPVRSRVPGATPAEHARKPSKELTCRRIQTRHHRQLGADPRTTTSRRSRSRSSRSIAASWSTAWSAGEGRQGPRGPEGSDDGWRQRRLDERSAVRADVSARQHAGPGGSD